MLVAAVLGPQQREDRELEVVRLPAEQAADPLELAVRQPEGAMKRLFRYRRQGIECSRLTGQVARAFYLALVPVVAIPSSSLSPAGFRK